MADVTVAGIVISASGRRGMRALVWATDQIGYYFFVEVTSVNFTYIKTTDGGQTWSGAVDINTSGTNVAFDVWFDQWTPGNAGTLIHTVSFDTSIDDVIYRSLDTNGDSLGTAVQIISTTSAVAGRGAFCSIARMRGGNLYVAYDVDAGAEHGLYRSTDVGGTWGIRTDPIEATIDQCFLFPGNEGNNQDCWLLYQDASTNELTLKVHDDSANTNSESSVIMAMEEETTDGVGQYGFTGAIRLSDGHLIATGWSAYDSAGASNWRIFDINGAASITELTAVASATDDCYWPGVYVADINDDIYLSYSGKRDGSDDIVGGSIHTYYTKSTNGGTTWSVGDTAYSETASGHRQMWVAPAGPRFAAAWRDAATSTVFSNYVNSVVPLADATGPLAKSVLVMQAQQRASSF